MAKDLRTFLNQLDEADEIVHLTREVDPLENVGTLCNQASLLLKKAVMFESVKGYPGVKMVSELVTTRKRLALALDCRPEEAVKVAFERMSMGVGQLNEVETGPVKEVKLLGDQADLFRIPVAVHSEGDGTIIGRECPYIGGGLAVVRDPDVPKKFNVSFHRMMVRERNRTGFVMIPRHLWMIYTKYETMNKPLPVAVFIGHHPAYYLAGAMTGPYMLNELELASKWLQEPVELVRCETSDLLVPAHAEVVIEGEVLPKIREPEGPFGEFEGMRMGAGGENPVFQAKAITMRKDTIYQHVQCGIGMEQQTLIGFPMAASIWQRIRDVEGGIDLLDVSIPRWGACFTAIVKMRPHFEGQAKNVLASVLSSSYLHPTIAIAVDEDVDPDDAEDVFHSLATRVNWGKDVFTIPDARMHPMRPSDQLVSPPGGRYQRVGTKIAIDATKPPTYDKKEREQFDKFVSKGHCKYSIRDFL